MSCRITINYCRHSDKTSNENQILRHKNLEFPAVGRNDWLGTMTSTCCILSVYSAPVQTWPFPHVTWFLCPQMLSLTLNHHSVTSPGNNKNSYNNKSLHTRAFKNYVARHRKNNRCKHYFFSFQRSRVQLICTWSSVSPKCRLCCTRIVLPALPDINLLCIYPHHRKICVLLSILSVLKQRVSHSVPNLASTVSKVCFVSLKMSCDVNLFKFKCFITAHTSHFPC